MQIHDTTLQLSITSVHDYKIIDEETKYMTYRFNESKLMLLHLSHYEMIAI
jgi:hypothetical protein